MEPKRIYRSRDPKMLAGVCQGLGNYFGIDPTIVRLLWIVFILVGGAGLIAYLIAWVIIPEEPISK